MPDTPEATASSRKSLQRLSLILAFDFGKRRIGVATGNFVTRTATAVATVEAVNGETPWAQIDKLVTEFGPNHLVVGYPRPPEEAVARPKTHSIQTRIKHFADTLAIRYGLDVDLVDETLTSRAAAAELHDARHLKQRQRRAKPFIDQYAARLIAEQWMNEQSVQEYRP